MKKDGKTINSALWIANGIAFLVALNLASSFFFFRVDLTEEKRYTVKAPTRRLLNTLDNNVYVEVFLAGDLNAGFTRLQRAIRETLEEFRILSDQHVQYAFTDPATAQSQKARQEFMQDLARKGIQPINIIDRKDGERTEKIVFPGALVAYNGFEKGVVLLKGNSAAGSEQMLNQSIEGLEFELASAIYQLTQTDRKSVGILTGHGELDSLSTADLRHELGERYDVADVDLTQAGSLLPYDALMMIRPTKPFSELDKWKLDQYLMRGGKLLLLIDRLNASMDDLAQKEHYALPYRLQIDDLLFRYGVRINLNLLQDRFAATLPIATGKIGNRTQFTPMLWPFFPLINHYAHHVITRNLDASLLRFASTVDTVRAAGIKKTPLLLSSATAGVAGSPVRLSVADLRDRQNGQKLDKGPFAVGYLLEGRFTSLFKNRLAPSGIHADSTTTQGAPAKIMVIADGDVARNEVNPQTRQAEPLGYDPMSSYTFANRSLLLNAMAYLTDAKGLIGARNKEVKIRPLNKLALKRDKFFWQAVNIALPLTLVASYGLLRAYVRRKKYTTR